MLQVNSSAARAAYAALLSETADTVDPFADISRHKRGRADRADLPSLITLGEMRLIYVAMNDAYVDAREGWLDAVISDYNAGAFPNGDNLLLTSVNSDCDVVIIGGNDVKRIAAAYCRSQAMLRGRVVICLMKGSSASRRAKLLMCGFDDVFDVNRMLPAEGIARLRAHWQRYQARRQCPARRVGDPVTLQAACMGSRLSPREAAVVSALCERSGEVVSYDQLQQVAGKSGQPISFENLKVMICKVRKKLKSGFNISCVRSKGYRVVV